MPFNQNFKVKKNCEHFQYDTRDFENYLIMLRTHLHKKHNKIS